MVNNIIKGHHLLLPRCIDQRGFATLLVVMGLLIGMMTISLTASRSGVLEQAVTGNDIRALEAQQAADAVLEYAMAWVSVNPIPWVGDAASCGTAPGCPTLPTGLTALKGNDSGVFQLSVQFSRNANALEFVKVAVNVQQPDNHSQASSSCYIFFKSGVAPPFNINCLPGTWKNY